MAAHVSAAGERDFVLPGALPASVAIGAIVLFFFNPGEYRFFPVCLFHAVTGLYCPSCGASRALHQLLHWHLLEALRLNALLVVSLPVFGVLSLRLLSHGKAARDRSTFVRPEWLWLFLGVSVLFGVLRNLPAFAWLAP